MTRYDVVIRGGTLYDGSGGPGYIGDLAINEDRIIALGDIGEMCGHREINAAGLAVSPGFINMMSWACTAIIQADQWDQLINALNRETGLDYQC